jgi:hypothetical protein
MYTGSACLPCFASAFPLVQPSCGQTFPSSKAVLTVLTVTVVAVHGAISRVFLLLCGIIPNPTTILLPSSLRQICLDATYIVRFASVVMVLRGCASLRCTCMSQAVTRLVAVQPFSS